MQVLMDIGKFLVEHYQEIIAAIVGLFTAALAIALLIPGDQPDKFLQSAVDFIKKFSRKADPK